MCSAEYTLLYTSDCVNLVIEMEPHCLQAFLLHRNHTNARMRRMLNSVVSRCGTRYHSTSVIEDFDIRGVRPFEEIPGPGGIYNTPIIGPAFHFQPFCKYIYRNTFIYYTSVASSKYPQSTQMLIVFGLRMVRVDMNSLMQNYMYPGCLRYTRKM